MSDKSTHGGARSAAGRPFTPIEQATEPQTPLMRHWQELARRFGQDVSDEMRAQFNEWSQEYQKARIAKERERRKQPFPFREQENS